MLNIVIGFDIFCMFLSLPIKIDYELEKMLCASVHISVQFIQMIFHYDLFLLSYNASATVAIIGNQGKIDLIF